MKPSKGSFSTLLAKIDIKSTFRLHPDDRYMLGMQWNREVFIDTCLPFCLGSAPKLFNFWHLLAWVAQQHNVSFLIHYERFPNNGASISPNLSTEFRYISTYLQLPWCPTCLGESRRPINSLTVPGYYIRYYCNGGQATWGKTLKSEGGDLWMDKPYRC